MEAHEQGFPLLWEVRIGKYLQLKIQQGNKGPEDLILYVSNGKGSIWQAVNRTEFLRAWNETRRDPIELDGEPIRNEAQLRYALRHALYGIVQRSRGYQELYHDLPNVLLGLAESERYVVTTRTRKQSAWQK
jgi:hypothetical protein